MPVPLRTDFDAHALRAIARTTKDGPQARRLLALAAIYDGATRTAAARSRTPQRSKRASHQRLRPGRGSPRGSPGRTHRWPGSPSRRPGPRCPRPKSATTKPLSRSASAGPRRHARRLSGKPPRLVRWWMRARSNSAMPAKTVSTILPAGEVVSAHGSPRLRRPAPPSFRSSAISSRSRVERASRSRRATTTTSPSRSWSSMRVNAGRSRVAPETFSS